jgi:type II secretory pathway pseudopilin PulG
VNLLEGIIGIAILSLTAAAGLAALLGGSRAVVAPQNRDQVLVAARNAAVEARAAAAYDAAAGSAILAAPPAAWTVNGIALQSSIDGQSLVVAASAGNQTASARYPVTREAVPEGAIVNASGGLGVP